MREFIPESDLQILVMRGLKDLYVNLIN